MSPSVGVNGGASSAFAKGQGNSEEMGPQDDYITVKIYFYGTDKALRTQVFPQDS